MNLIICTSPLQFLIAEQIISNSDEKFISIVFTMGNNEKQHYYSSKLIKISTKCFLINIEKINFKIYSFLFLINLRFIIINRIKKYNINKVFLASIDSIHIHTFLSALGKSNNFRIYTFDDGFANILITSHYYRKRKQNLIYTVVSKILGNCYSLDRIKSELVVHYTIYPNMENITDKIYNISLFNKSKLIEKEPYIENYNQEISFFLGQPLLLNNIIYSDFIKYLFNRYNINYYYPHPKEKKTNITDIKYVKGNLIFEDYLISLIKSNPSLKYKIYTFFSSAALNIYNISDRVEIISIYSSKYIPKEYHKCFDIFVNLGISVHEINNL